MAINLKDLPEEPYLVLEISSNTVHFTIFDDNGEVHADEKHQCMLGDYKKNTKTLKENNVKGAVEFIEKCIGKYSDIEFTDIIAIGTGALREADNKDELIEHLNNEFDIDIEVLSGEEEAYYSALGVKHSFEEADGVVWDMGGRSSEFATIKDGKIENCISLSLGAYSIADQDYAPDIYIMDQLDQLPQEYKDMELKHLYVVGGNPRQILKSHKKYTDVHAKLEGYTINESQAEELSSRLINTAKEKLHEKYKISKKRVKSAPHAARLLMHLIERFKITDITASKHGLRHGVFENMIEQQQYTPDLAAEIQPPPAIY